MVKKMIDKLVNNLIQDVDAGACVPTAGQCCPKQSRMIVSCTGPCVWNYACPL